MAAIFGSCEWGEAGHYAQRSHRTKPVGEGQGTPSRTDPVILVVVDAEEHAVTSRGRRGPSLLDDPLVGLHIEDDEQAVFVDLTADRARQLAGWLLAAADRLDVITTPA